MSKVAKLAKQRVLKVYPDAYAAFLHDFTTDNGQHIIRRTARGEAITFAPLCADYTHSEDQAWIDAASRLPVVADGPAEGIATEEEVCANTAEKSGTCAQTAMDAQLAEIVSATNTTAMQLNAMDSTKKADPVEPAAPVQPENDTRCPHGRIYAHHCKDCLYPSQPAPVVVPGIGRICENCDKPYGKHFAVDPDGTATCYQGGEELFRYVDSSANTDEAPVVVRPEETPKRVQVALERFGWRFKIADDAKAMEFAWNELMDVWDHHSLTAQPAPLPSDQPKPLVSDIIVDIWATDHPITIGTKLAEEVKEWRAWAKAALPVGQKDTK